MIKIMVEMNHLRVVSFYKLTDVPILMTSLPTLALSEIEPAATTSLVLMRKRRIEPGIARMKTSTVSANVR